jgi:glycosyltransferase involved in cell wall biosynthesis
MGDQCDLTAIIPTHNRAEVLEKCIRALGRQSIPADSYEVVVCDDGSSDDTRGRVEAASREVACPVRYLFQTNRGANSARNRAVGEAEGRILLFINDDTIATPGMLEAHLDTHAGYPDEAVGVLGKVAISPEVPPSFFAKLHLDASYDLWEGEVDLDWRAFYTCNVSVKKTFLLKYGLFEEGLRYHEDVELSERLSHFGFRIIYNVEALAYHYHFLTEDAFLRAAGRDGTALAQWHRKSPNLRKELACFGFAETSSPLLRMKHKLGDMLINRWTIPYLLPVARYFSRNMGGLALTMYRKIYQSLKREAARNALKDGG